MIRDRFAKVPFSCLVPHLHCYMNSNAEGRTFSHVLKLLFLKIFVQNFVKSSNVVFLLYLLINININSVFSSFCDVRTSQANQINELQQQPFLSMIESKERCIHLKWMENIEDTQILLCL